MTTPGPGDILYLASCVMQLGVSAVTTSPDTPNQYTAVLKVMGDAGNMDLSPVTGPAGPAGQAQFQLRSATQFGYPPANNPSELPDLTSSSEDIGLYWLIDDLDDAGHILAEWCYIWWGSFYRQIMMGSVGAPGPVPQIEIDMTAVDPSLPPQILTSGATLYPSWQFLCPSPTGPPGLVSALADFPDVDETTNPPAFGDVLAFTGRYTGFGSELPGAPIWEPFSLGQYLPQPFSLPQNAFTAYTGIAQQANIAAFELPHQAFPWTPLVWGHLSAGGLSTGSQPLMIGAQVLLNDQVNGQQIARGIGTTLGEINITPHYSTPKKPHTNITPTNALAVIPAAPSALTAIVSTAGGTLSAGTYFYVVGAVNNTSGAVALSSAEASAVTTGAKSSVILEWPAAGGATSYNIYRGHSSGVENKLVGATTDTTFTDTGALAASVTLPADTVTVYVNLWNDGQLGFFTFSPTIQRSAFMTSLNTLLGTLAHPTISGVLSQLESWGGGISSQLQDALNAVGGLVGGGGHSLQPAVSDAQTYLTNLQPLISDVADALGSTSVPNILTLLNSFTGSWAHTVTTDIQTALDAVANSLNFTGTGHGVTNVVSYLTNLQTALNSTATALGATNNNIGDVLSTIGSFAGIISTDLQNGLDAIAGALNFTGINHTINDIERFLTGVTATNTSLLPSSLNTLATTLGANEISNVLTLLGSFTGTITSGIQSALDQLANQFGLLGTGHTPTIAAASLASLQSPLADLQDLLDDNTLIADVATLLNSFTGTPPTSVQSALDAVANSLGVAGHGIARSTVISKLTNLQNSINGVTTALDVNVTTGLSGVVSLLSTWIASPISGVLQSAIGVMITALGDVGLEPTVHNALGSLFARIGNVFSHYSTDAQLFAIVQPVLNGVLI